MGRGRLDERDIIMGLFGGKDYGELKDYQQELARGRTVRRRQGGLRTVPVARVVGSVSKAASMDRRFRYKSGKVDERLRRLRLANRHAQAIFPPVDLYQINDEYYVVDGHHRLAVALENDQPEIDADVLIAHEVEFPPAPAEESAPKSEPSWWSAWLPGRA
jgi:hypothetical protein